MKPRFLTDEDWKDPIVRAILRLEPSIEICSVRECGLSGQPDSLVLEFANRDHWLLLSYDVNTMIAEARQRMQKRPDTDGTFYAHEGRSHRRIAETVVLIWTHSELEDWDQQIEFLPW